MAEPTESLLIATPEALADLADELRRTGRFALDTEFVSEETFEPVLCLIQIATPERLLVVDPMALRDLSPFWEVVNDPAVEVVMHAASEDLRIARCQTRRVPERVFDVQIAAGLVGYGYPLSLSNLMMQTLHVSVFSGETRTDWRRRPLTEAQLRYALDDVRYLLPLADRLKERLDQWGRADWAETEFRDFLDGIQSRDDESRWRRLPGLHQLSRRGLETARCLFDWRYSEAKRQNRPIRQVLRDELLVAIAKRQPASRQDLEALRDFNRPHLLARSQAILATIAKAQATPADELPEHSERHEEGPGLTMIVNLLAAALANCCAKKKVATALVGSTGDLKELIRWHALGRPDDRRPFLASGWRDEVCGGTLLDVLAGRNVLRVVDLHEDVPVAVEPLGTIET